MKAGIITFTFEFTNLHLPISASGLDPPIPSEASSVVSGVVSQAQSVASAAVSTVNNAGATIPQNLSVGTKQYCVGFSDHVECDHLPVDISRTLPESLTSGLGDQAGKLDRPRGITSNVIAPGPIAATEGTKRLMRSKWGENLRGGIPAGRWGTVKEVADATIYLFADTGSYVNGATIVVDGSHWRTQGANDNADFSYPDFLLSKNITGVGDAKL